LPLPFELKTAIRPEKNGYKHYFFDISRQLYCKIYFKINGLTFETVHRILKDKSSCKYYLGNRRILQLEIQTYSAGSYQNSCKVLKYSNFVLLLVDIDIENLKPTRKPKEPFPYKWHLHKNAG